MKLYQIRDLANKSERSVYSIQQLANLIAKPKSIAKVYSTRLIKNNLATRIIRGKISFNDDLYIIATQLIEPSYISLFSALAFHQKIIQVPAFVQCVTPINSRNYLKLGIKYHKIPSKLFYGYQRYKKGNSYIFVADPEKALIDLIYLNLISKKEAREIEIDKQKLRICVDAYSGRGGKKIKRWLYD